MMIKESKYNLTPSKGQLIFQEIEEFPKIPYLSFSEDDENGIYRLYYSSTETLCPKSDKNTVLCQ